MIENMVRKTLTEYDFELNDKGVQAIVFQVILAYGKKAKQEQVKEIVQQNKISFLQEYQ